MAGGWEGGGVGGCPVNALPYPLYHFIFMHGTALTLMLTRIMLSHCLKTVQELSFGNVYAIFKGLFSIIMTSLHILLRAFINESHYAKANFLHS